MGEVGTRKIFENDRIIVWEFQLEPGEQTPLHTHEHDYVWYVVEGSRLQASDADDRPIGEFDSNTGETFAFECVDGELVSTDGKGLRAPATHSARNVGSGRYREILVEMKPQR
jgi:redox-sensitive bicupin YhaK (pirin superfamily)